MADVSKQSIEEISRRWVDSFRVHDPEAFAAAYSDAGEYIDHAFQIRRAGRESIALHFKIWLDAIKDFNMRVEEFHVVGRQSLFSYVGTGTFENDLPRLAATGTAFTFQGFVALTVDDAGLIERTEEFYSTSFPKGVPFEDYNFRGSKDSAVR